MILYRSQVDRPVEADRPLDQLGVFRQPVAAAVLFAEMLAAWKAETSWEIPPGRFLVASAEMLVLLPFSVVLRNYTLVTLDPWTDTCDVIVMGTHGRTALTRLILGSVAEAVLRKVGCPVLTAKVPARLKQTAKGSETKKEAGVVAGADADWTSGERFENLAEPAAHNLAITV